MLTVCTQVIACVVLLVTYTAPVYLYKRTQKRDSKGSIQARSCSTCLAEAA